MCKVCWAMSHCAFCDAADCTDGCASCGDSYYCNEMCQLADWEHHQQYECVDGRLRQTWYWAKIKTRAGRQKLIRKVVSGQLTRSKLLDLQQVASSKREYGDLRAAVDAALRSARY